jgi:hypothetical protein
MRFSMNAIPLGVCHSDRGSAKRLRRPRHLNAIFQLHRARHRRLWRHCPAHNGRADDGHSRSDPRTILSGGSNRTSRRVAHRPRKRFAIEQRTVGEAVSFPLSSWEGSAFPLQTKKGSSVTAFAGVAGTASRLAPDICGSCRRRNGSGRALRIGSRLECKPLS